jgi:LPXTG-motif cell wall-anchored protein
MGEMITSLLPLLLLVIIGLVIGLLTRRRRKKTCPMCAETVKAGARVCRFCGHRFDPR